MKLHARLLVTSIFVLSISKPSLAGPWFTGPLLAGSGHTIPKGHTNFEVYDFNTSVLGIYDDSGNVTPVHGSRSYAPIAIFSHGLTEKLDVQFVLPYNINRVPGAHSHGIGDTSVAIGYQFLEQKDSRWRPDLRVFIQEVIPTGRYDELNPAKKETDAFGLGSYQTAINFDFQHLAQLSEKHYLRTRLDLTYLTASNVHIHGISAYGGNPMTDGVTNPGDLMVADLAAELSLTQHWVAVMEVFANKREKSTFQGMPGTDAEGNFDTIGRGVGKQVSLAPAIEYNFTSNIGIIGGVWYTVHGRGTAKFASYVVALNTYW